MKKFVKMVLTIALCSFVLSSLFTLSACTCKHEWSDWTTLSVATCETEGSEERVCNKCGEKEQQPVSALGHNEVPVEAVAATCTKDGKTAGKRCIYCNKITVQQEVIKARGHNFVTYKYNKDATCLTDGTKTATCTRCSVKDTVVAENTALGHNFATYRYNNDATCLTDGTKTATCTRCKVKDTVMVENTALGHNEVVDKAVAPTCTAPGKTEGKHCSRCGIVFTKQESLKALGHYLTHHEARAATCTNIGWEEYDTCTSCEYTTYQEIAATGHKWGIELVATVAACDTDGVFYKFCSVCSEKETRIIPKLGHVKSDTAFAKKNDFEFFRCYVCLRCNKVVEERYNPITAHIYLSSLTGGASGWDFSWGINAKDGFTNKYQYAFIVTDKNTGKVLYWSSSMQDSSIFTFHSDSNDHLNLTNPLRVVVYISDGVGTVAYMFEMNTIFNVANISIYQPYVLDENVNN